VRRFSGWIGALTGFTLVGSIGFAGWTAYNRISEYVTSNVRTLVERTSPADLDEVTRLTKATLKYLIEKPDDKYLGLIFFVGLILALASIIFSAVVVTLAESTKPSFVVLTSKSEESRNLELQRDQNNWSTFMVSIWGALFISVVGNYLFYLILKYYLQR
jgi:hypothetical protein